MELPLGTEGRKATHDFLSLYSPIPPSAHVQQDPPPPPQGGHLKTHDFLQPLEREGSKNGTSAKQESRGGGMAAVQNPPEAAAPTAGRAAASVEHLLPGGIGTYSISYFNQRPMLQGTTLFTTGQACSSTTTTTGNDENSNCSSYTAGSGFTLWDESATKKGKTGKENIASQRHVLQEAGVNVLGGQWTSSLQPSSQHNKHNPATFSSFSSSQLSSSQNNQSFMDMISAKNEQEEDDDDDDHEERFIIKKELSSHPRGNLSVKIETKSIDQRPSTPRSKHSATEQRRRSKINDRFQKLREIIPNSDQKRDKASFLLEVIDYIHFLQEKVNRYENPYNTWNHESSKMGQPRNSHVAECSLDHSRGAKTEICSASKFDKNKGANVFDKNKGANVSPSIQTNGRHLIVSDISTAATFKERDNHHQQQQLLQPTVQPSIFTFGRSCIAASTVSPKLASDADKTTTWPTSSQFQLNRLCTTDNCSGSGQEPTIESGTINISSVYSQGLLRTLTKALQGSGVDLSHTSVSVQIDLGKRACDIHAHSSLSSAKDDEQRPKDVSTGEADRDRALKKLRSI